jgi:hypothetical protein
MGDAADDGGDQDDDSVIQHAIMARVGGEY